MTFMTMTSVCKLLTTTVCAYTDSLGKGILHFELD